MGLHVRSLGPRIAALVLALLGPSLAMGQTVGPNVNMVSGIQLGDGDPRLQGRDHHDRGREHRGRLRDDLTTAGREGRSVAPVAAEPGRLGDLGPGRRHQTHGARGYRWGH